MESKMIPIRTASLTTLFLMGLAGQAIAHFGMVIPSEHIVTPQKKNVQLTLSFSHPFEGIGMDLAKPEKWYMVMDGNQTDLSTTLLQDKVMDHTAWQSQVEIKRPGVYWFVMEPKPYWEPAEDVFIIHYSKPWLPPLALIRAGTYPLAWPLKSFPCSGHLATMPVTVLPAGYCSKESRLQIPRWKSSFIIKT